ncbi:MAG: helix-turn-helix domain-containing protein [Nitrospira sp.]|nr:helix-turn-helix domain-containing protein [Nitrospira sp.]
MKKHIDPPLRRDGFDRLLTVREAADLLALKPSTIRKKVLMRQIDVVRPTKRAVRIPESAVREILKLGYRPAIDPERGS